MKTARFASSFDVCDYKQLDKHLQLYTTTNSFIQTYIREAQFWQIDYQKIAGRNTVIPKIDISFLSEFYRLFSFNYTTLTWL